MITIYKNRELIYPYFKWVRVVRCKSTSSRKKYAKERYRSDNTGRTHVFSISNAFIRSLKHKFPVVYDTVKHCILGLGLSAVVRKSLFVVPPGNRGIVCALTGGVRDKVYSEGVSLVVPFFDVRHLYDVRSSPFTVKSTFFCLDGEEVEVGVRVLVRPRPEHLPELVRSFGHHYQGIICLKMILATCSSLIAGYAINELLSHPEAFRRDLLAQLAMKASEFYLVVDDVSIIKAEFAGNASPSSSEPSTLSLLPAFKLVTPNLYGNFVSNVAAGIAGGTGVMPGGNVGPEHAVFEKGASVGNVGKLELVEQKKANPVALFLSSAMMLRHLQFPSFADRLETAVQHVIEEGKYRTKDLGGNSTPIS